MKNKSVFFYYIKNNKKNLILLILIFLIGMIAGITFINRVNGEQMQEISSYVNSLTDNLKSSDHINKTVILIQSMKQNIAFAGVIWLLGCTLLGSFLIYVAILYKGFSIGYTASAIIATLGVKSRHDFCSISVGVAKLSFLANLVHFIR